MGYIEVRIEADPWCTVVVDEDSEVYRLALKWQESGDDSDWQNLTDMLYDDVDISFSIMDVEV